MRAFRKLIETIHGGRQQRDHALEPDARDVIELEREPSSLHEIGRGQGRNFSHRRFLDVVAVEPVQFFHIKNSRGRSDPFQREFPNQLLRGKHFTRAAARRPAQQDQVIGERFRQHAHLAKVGNRRRPVALGQPLAVAAENGGKVRELRHGPVESLIQRHLFRRIGEMVVAADDVGNLHQRIVDDDYVVVNRNPGRAQDDGIAHHLIREFDLAVHDVVKTNGSLRNAQADGARFAGLAASQRLFGIEAATGSWINRLAMLGVGQFALLLKFRVRAKAQIRLALGQQPLGVLAIDGDAVGLAIRRIRPSKIGALIPIEAKPLQVGDELILKARLAALEVGVFDAQNHGAAGFAGVEPVDERRAGVADVQLTRRRRRKTDANGGIGGHGFMLAGWVRLSACGFRPSMSSGRGQRHSRTRR